eukprot:7752198-Lingulodinium_polyedra.AAC.1
MPERRSREQRLTGNLATALNLPTVPTARAPTTETVQNGMHRFGDQQDTRGVLNAPRPLRTQRIRGGTAEQT